MAFFELTAKKIKTNVQNILNNCTVTFFLGQGAHVEGHNGLMSFSSEEIIFRQKKGVVKVTGRKLNLTEINKTDAYVKGNIKSVCSEGEYDE